MILRAKRRIGGDRVRRFLYVPLPGFAALCGAYLLHFVSDVLRYVA
jgi:hypothetical protein